MQLRCYYSLWGHEDSEVVAVHRAKAGGYDGVEGPAPASESAREQFAQALRDNQLDYIAEIATAGGYVPDRRWNVQQQLDDFAHQLTRAAALRPGLITCLGGCDAWPLADSLAFFREARAMAADAGLTVSFETHRGRSLFNPWVTQAVVEAMPEIALTFDISHWCVVCEGLQETEWQLVAKLAPHARHIHARVGYDQGPQVSDPRLGAYREPLNRHLHAWTLMWEAQAARSQPVCTMTPEFGPDGYEYRSVDGQQALVDIREINSFMKDTLREAFMQWQQDRPAPALQHG